MQKFNGYCRFKSVVEACIQIFSEHNFFSRASPTLIKIEFPDQADHLT